MSDSNSLASNGKATADPQTTDGDLGQPGSEREDAETAFDSSLLDTIVKKHRAASEQSTDKVPVNTPPTAEVVRQKTLDKWSSRVLNEETDDEGRTYDLENPNMPNWVKKEIEKSLSPKEDKKEVKFDALEYKLLQREIPALTASKQQKIAESFDSYMSLGENVDPVRALKLAMRDLEKTDEAYKRGLQRQRKSAISNGDPIMTRQPSALSESAERLGQQLGIKAEDRTKHATNHFSI